MVLKTYVKGEVILAEGTTGDRTFLIRSGEVLICKMLGEGNFLPLAQLREGEVFGEMYLFEKNGARNATALAATDVSLEVIFQEDLEIQLKSLKPNIQLILNGLSNRLTQSNRQFILSQRHKAQESNSYFRRASANTTGDTPGKP